MYPKVTSIKSFVERSLPLLLIALLSACAGGSGQISDSDMAIRQAASDVDSYEQDDVFRKGDFVRVELNGVPASDLGSYDLKIDESGNISMPHIGSITAAGLNSVTLKEKIEVMYKMGQIYNNPNVTVTSQQARFVSVSGEVRSPQRIYHAKDLTVLGAIATCGGFTDFSDRKEVMLLRRGNVIIFNANEMIEDPTKDIPLLPDDKIQVQKSVF
jgi:polysaccharide export outer membrane protein